MTTFYPLHNFSKIQKQQSFKYSSVNRDAEIVIPTLNTSLIYFKRINKLYLLFSIFTFRIGQMYPTTHTSQEEIVTAREFRRPHALSVIPPAMLASFAIPPIKKFHVDFSLQYQDSPHYPP
jgi:hypothetical protein